MEGDYQGVVKIIRCMQDWREHEEVQEKGCIEVNNLCSNQYHRELLREAGAIEAVVDALMTFPNSLKVQLTAMRAITNLSAGTDPTRLRLGVAGTGRVLVQGLARFSQDQSVLMSTWGGAILRQAEELRCLCVIAMAHLLQLEHNLIPLLEAGSWEIVVRSMAKYPADDELQLWGCRILATLAEGLNKSGAANTQAMEMIMKRTPASQVVVAASVRVLNQLMAAAGGGQLAIPSAYTDVIIRGGWLTSCALAALASISQENATQLVGLGACVQVERIMALCHHELVQEWGARALAEIALSIRGGGGVAGGNGNSTTSTTQGRVLRANGGGGGCAAVLNALAKFPQSTGVQFAGCYAIANLAGEGRENQSIFYELGAAQAVSRALEMFPTDENIQEWGTRAFAELACENEANQMAVLDAAGCSALVGALARFPHVGRVQFAACYAIVNLASANAHCRKRLGEAGACRHIGKGMSDPCAADPNVLEWACRALGDLANGNLDNQTRTRETGGCRQIVQALANFPFNARVQFAGCYALTQLAAGNRQNQMEFGEAGACERLVQAIVDYAKDSNVRTWGFRALIALATKQAIATRLMEAGCLFDMVKVLKENSFSQAGAQGGATAAATTTQKKQQQQVVVEQQQQQQQQRAHVHAHANAHTHIHRGQAQGVGVDEKAAVATYYQQQHHHQQQQHQHIHTHTSKDPGGSFYPGGATGAGSMGSLSGGVGSGHLTSYPHQHTHTHTHTQPPQHHPAYHPQYPDAHAHAHTHAQHHAHTHTQQQQQQHFPPSGAHPYS